MKLASALGLAALVASAAVARPARADNAKADEKFKLGKKLLAQKHYADACAAFEDSNRIDPGIGIELNVGHCYEEWGKFATAYHAYEAAAQMAKSAHDKRLPQIRERIDALEPSVPRLTIALPAGADPQGLVVTLDGDRLPASELGKEQRLDPGPHKVEWAVGDAKRSKLVPLERGGASDVTLDVPKPDVAEPDKQVGKRKGRDRDKDAAKDSAKTDGETDKTDKADKTDKTDKSSRMVLVVPGHTRRVEGAIAIVTGGVAMGVSGVLTFSARGKYKDALAADCSGSSTMCNDVGLTATHDALHEANIATVVFGVGAAVAVTGIVLYLTAPNGHPHAERDDAMRVLPTFGPDGAGLAALGRF